MLFQFYSGECDGTLCYAKRGTDVGPDWKRQIGGIAPVFMGEAEKAVFCSTFADYQAREDRKADWAGVGTAFLAIADVALAV